MEKELDVRKKYIDPLDNLHEFDWQGQTSDIFMVRHIITI
jgi:hypothetical protein